MVVIGRDDLFTARFPTPMTKQCRDGDADPENLDQDGTCVGAVPERPEDQNGPNQIEQLEARRFRFHPLH